MALTDILLRFSPILLKEMEGVSLMKRVDTKYLVNTQAAEKVIASLTDHYRILSIGGERLFHYRTTYYDTPHREMLYDHLRGKMNREKVRVRDYVGTGCSFLEVKLKTNRGETDKRRINSAAGEHEFNGSEAEFLENETPFEAEDLVPAMNVQFDRITFVNIDQKERVTLDVNLQFEHGQNQAELPGLAIIELKHEKAAQHGSEFVQLLRQQHERPFSMSKYCVGMILLGEATRFNLYKPKLLRINKLIQHGTSW